MKPSTGIVLWVPQTCNPLVQIITESFKLQLLMTDIIQLFYLCVLWAICKNGYNDDAISESNCYININFSDKGDQNGTRNKTLQNRTNSASCPN